MSRFTKAVTASVVGLIVPMLSTPVTATPEWAPNPRWSQFNVEPGAGIFQQNLRVFDSSGAPATDDAGQHNNAYIRTDVRSVTVAYDCTKAQGASSAPASACAGKKVQFAVDTNAFDYNPKTGAFTRIKLSFDGYSQKAAFNGFSQGMQIPGVIYRNAIADNRGVARLTIGVVDAGTVASGNTLMADDFLGISVSNCDRTISSNTCDDSDVAEKIGRAHV